METENQVRGYSGAIFKGYTAADEARSAYEEYVKSKQSENAVPSDQRDVDESMNPTKWSAVIVAKKHILNDDYSDIPTDVFSP